MPHYILKETQDLGGFSLTSARAGEQVKVLRNGFFTSDSIEFHKFIEGIYKNLLSKYIPIENCNKFLIIRKKDKTAEVYINDFQLIATIRTRNAVKKGAKVRKKDIADITKLTFDNITIENTDAVILCFRVGWKFGFYFDFRANPIMEGSIELDVDQLYSLLGEQYRHMLFEREYTVFKDAKIYPLMIKDGWFPFIEIIGKDLGDLSRYYSNGWLDQTDTVVNRFDKKRIKSFTQYWWDKPRFKEKKVLLEAGLSAFLSESDTGYIHCINTLIPQIEGIMGYEYFLEHGEYPRFKPLKDYILERAQEKYPSPDSLVLPNYFYEYLDQQIFHKFNLPEGETELGRHSVAHGQAKVEDYTKAKALQLILTLNQISFYL